jgi:hypothetical protein
MKDNERMKKIIDKYKTEIKVLISEKDDLLKGKLDK